MMTECANDRLSCLQNTIAAVCKNYDRDEKAVTLIGVSKTFSQEAIRPFLKAGLQDFGENRVQESLAKWPELKKKYPTVRLHLIGPLQSNKAAEAVGLFDVIHTVDRPKIARVLGQEMERQQRVLPCFLQVNIGDEPQKAGVSLDDLNDLYDYAVKKCGLEITGLMCIPPVDKEPYPYFALLKQKADILGVKHLSMGMSSDYDQAIAMGATHIRVGSALFGQRD
jgi:pyridoxal phosphate enzyme (YggS family)